MTKEEGLYILKKLKEMHPNAKCELDFSSPFELLVAVILSAQCTDERVNKVTRKLFADYQTPEEFAEMSLDLLKKYIYSCGFFNNKGNNIIEASRMICRDFGGEVPKNMDDLVSLPGVGRKTASVVLSVAYGIPAMPVDTHVFRVSRRLGLSAGDTVDKVEKDLESMFSVEDWYDVHHALIFHGRYICKSRNPMCENCLLRDKCKSKDKR